MLYLLHIYSDDGVTIISDYDLTFIMMVQAYMEENGYFCSMTPALVKAS